MNIAGSTARRRHRVRSASMSFSPRRLNRPQVSCMTRAFLGSGACRRSPATCRRACKTWRADRRSSARSMLVIAVATCLSGLVASPRRSSGLHRAFWHGVRPTDFVWISAGRNRTGSMATGGSSSLHRVGRRWAPRAAPALPTSMAAQSGQCARFSRVTRGLPTRRCTMPCCVRMKAMWSLV